jgi:hypothetical protein
VFQVILGSSFPARFTLVSLLTVAYAGAVLINNNLLFPWAADSVYRHWIFLPAGLQLLFVMLFGWRGVLGLTFGAAAEYLSHPLGLNIPSALFVAGIDAISVWLGIEFYSVATGNRYPWAHISWKSVPVLSLVTAVLSAVGVFFAMMAAGIETSQHALRDIALFSLGDFVGASLFFVLVLLIRRELVKAGDHLG